MSVAAEGTIALGPHELARPHRSTLATLALITAAWLPLSQGALRLLQLRGAPGLARLPVQYAKDGALGVLVIAATLLVASGAQRPRRAFFPLVVAFTGLAAYLFAIFVVNGPSISAIYAIRVYAEPVLGGLALGIMLQRGGRRDALPGLLAIVSTLVVVLGVLQILFPLSPLTAAIRQSMLDEQGELPGVFVTTGDALRAFSTLDGPNELGYFAVLTALASYAPSPWLDRHPRWRWLTRVLAVVAVMISYSRSSLLAAIIGGVTLAVTYVMWDKRANGARVLRNVVIAIAFGICALAMLWVKREEISAVQNIVDAVTGADASARAHSQSLQEGLHRAVEAPAGIGLGNVGSRAGLYGTQGRVFTVESAYLLIALEMGWPGLAIAVLVILTAIGGTLALGDDRTVDDRDRQWARVSAAIIIAQVTVFVFLPNTEQLETGALTWTFLGLILCRSSHA